MSKGGQLLAVEILRETINDSAQTVGFNPVFGVPTEGAKGKSRRAKLEGF